jgi:AcrR family transcriptional regulator
MTSLASPGRPQQFTDNALLDAAVEVFDKAGYEGAHMSAIAAAAGTTKPTLYARLGSKEDVYVRAVEREARILGDHLLETYGRVVGMTVAERIEVGTRAAFQYGIDRPAGFRVLFGTGGGGPDIDREALVLKRIRSGILELMREYRSAHGAKTGPEVELLASLTISASLDGARFAMEHGGVSLERAGRIVSGFLIAALEGLDPRVLGG